MQESAGNEYMDLTISGISITVYATQDTVESDSFGKTYDANATYPVVAVGDVNTDGDTVIQDREKDPTVIATIPAGSTDAGKLTLVKTEGQTPANIEIVTGTDAVTTEVRLEDQNGNKVSGRQVLYHRPAAGEEAERDWVLSLRDTADQGGERRGGQGGQRHLLL